MADAAQLQKMLIDMKLHLENRQSDSGAERGSGPDRLPAAQCRGRLAIMPPDRARQGGG